MTSNMNDFAISYLEGEGEWKKYYVNISSVQSGSSDGLQGEGVSPASMIRISIQLRNLIRRL